MNNSKICIQNSTCVNTNWIIAYTDDSQER